jgi:PAS domain S-box-containing protein
MTTVFTLRDAPDKLSIRAEADTEVQQIEREEDLLAALVSHEAGTLVLGPSVELPLEVAQRASQIDESLAIVIVRDEVSTRDMQLRMRYMPHLGGDVRFVAQGDAKLLGTTLRDATRRTEARRRYKQLVRTLPDSLPSWKPAVPRSFLDSLLEQAPVGVVMISANGTLMACNPRAVEFLRLGDRKVVGGGLNDLRIVPGCAPLVDFLEESLLDARQTRAATVFTEFGEGDRQFCEVIVSPVEADESRPGRLALLRDVGGRVAAEYERRELDRRTRDTERLQELGLLAGGIAHDFNNILVGILGFAELGLQRASSDQTLARLLGGVVDAARQASELTHQMLAYAGRSEGELQRVDFNSLVVEISRLLDASVPKGAIDLRLDRDPLPVKIDVAQWKRILLNLVTNAADSLGEERGRIIITSERVRLHEARQAAVTSVELRPGRYARLEVTDTGCGMNAVVLEHLFDPFYTTKVNGRGLGLSAVLGIVRSHLGEIHVKSVVGEGSTFEILLPLCGAIDQEPSPDEESRRGGAGLILVIDDEPMVRDVAEIGLELQGYQVITANNGREGIETLQQNPAIDLVLLDLSMPILDGRETLNEMKRLGLRTPVILSSGYREQDAPLRVEFSNLVAFLSKPFEIAELSAQIKKVLGRPPA